MPVRDEGWPIGSVVRCASRAGMRIIRRRYVERHAATDGARLLELCWRAKPRYVLLVSHLRSDHGLPLALRPVRYERVYIKSEVKGEEV